MFEPKLTSADSPGSATRTDWVERFPADFIDLRPEDKSAVIGHIAACFATVGALDSFIAANFNNDFGAGLRQELDPAKSVLENTEACFRKACAERLMVALVMSVHHANVGNAPLGSVAGFFMTFYRANTGWLFPWAAHDENRDDVRGSFPEATPEKAGASSACSCESCKTGVNLRYSR